MTEFGSMDVYSRRDNVLTRITFVFSDTVIMNSAMVKER